MAKGCEAEKASGAGRGSEFRQRRLGGQEQEPMLRTPRNSVAEDAPAIRMKDPVLI